MEKKYYVWLERKKIEPRGGLIIDTVHRIGLHLDNGKSATEALKLIFCLKLSKLALEERTKVALAISILHPRGDELRLEWNKYYRGEQWALGMELTEKRLFNPV